MPKFSKTAVFYSLIALVMFLAGLVPMVFNLVVDPYEMNKFVDMDLNKAKISEKAHYPLWKVIHYPEEMSDTIILGDSRARALKDKYWYELGVTGAYNFGYGGATLYEIYDTFHYVKNKGKLKTLIIGIQLRSFDPNHKGRMNRVPEAIRLTQNPLKYYTNWFVSTIGMKHIQKKYSQEFKWIARLKPSLVSSAHAAEVPKEDPLQELLEPVICENCLLPENVPPQLHPSSAIASDYYFANDLGVWKTLWSQSNISRSLPKKFDHQVRKNAAATWRSFSFSEQFWSYLVEISLWCKQNNVTLVFVIPPTIVEMQTRTVEFGYGALNHSFRERLTKLATVVDFDFDSPLTRDLTRFTDAYHFNYKASKLIVGEITQLASDDEKTIALARKRRKDIICPLQPQDISNRVSDDIIEVLEGKSCRIWRLKNE